eukprot:TRINITY_DN82352_c0_g1_i1.p1 TRINITY_DN82352_c0_g1~~TRINITY_DN82352_c0_g1_i1.p1  ORF type:complete len:179 (+),score=41.89 TRINITY_DN82352_c0_g1_i1:100-636(+)
MAMAGLAVPGTPPKNMRTPESAVELAAPSTPPRKSRSLLSDVSPEALKTPEKKRRLLAAAEEDSSDVETKMATKKTRRASSKAKAQALSPKKGRTAPDPKKSGNDPAERLKLLTSLIHRAFASNKCDSLQKVKLLSCVNNSVLEKGTESFPEAEFNTAIEKLMEMNKLLVDDDQVYMV